MSQTLDTLPADILGSIGNHLHVQQLICFLITCKVIRLRLLSSSGVKSIRVNDLTKNSQNFLNPPSIVHMVEEVRKLTIITSWMAPAPLYGYFPKTLTSLFFHYRGIPSLIAKDDMEPFDYKTNLPLLIDLTLEDFENLLSEVHLSLLPDSLTRLDLKSRSITDQIYRHLPQGLSTLKLACSNTCANLKNLPSYITKLDIELPDDAYMNNYPDSWDRPVKSEDEFKIPVEFSRLTNLVSLNIGGSRYYSRHQFSRFTYLPSSLKHLEITAKTAKQESLSHLTSLQTLALNYSDFQDLPSSITWLQFCNTPDVSLPMAIPPNVTYLAYQGQWNDTMISQLQNQTNLKWFHYSGYVPFAAKQFEILPRNLTQLNLCIDDNEIAEYIDDLPKSLLSLALRNKSFTPKFELSTVVRFPLNTIKSISLYEITVYKENSMRILASKMEEKEIFEFSPNDSKFRRRLYNAFDLTHKLIGSSNWLFIFDPQWASILPRSLTKLDYETASKWTDKEIEHLPKTLKFLRLLGATAFSDSTLALLPEGIEHVYFENSEDFSLNLMSKAPKSLRSLVIGKFKLTSGLGEFLDPSATILNTQSFIHAAERFVFNSTINVSLVSKSGWIESIDDSLTKWISSSKVIEEIDLEGSILTNDFLSLLPLNLKKLILKRNNLITNEGFQKLSESTRRNLIHLGLPWNRLITDQCSEILPTNLQSLILSYSTEWSDKGIEKLPLSLTELDLNSCANLTHDCASHLPKGLKVLRFQAAQFNESTIDLLPKGLEILQLPTEFDFSNLNENYLPPNLKFLSIACESSKKEVISKRLPNIEVLAVFEVNNDLSLAGFMEEE